MMRQYQTMRRSLPDDVLLLYRLGDFYEMFFEDAKIGAGILNLTLTRRNGIPMCGVPHHAAEGYVQRLIRGGKRVAIAEQTSDPVPGKLVEREISQIISAGTVMDLNMLDSGRNNYLAAVWQDKGRCGLAYVDNTTGEFRVAEYADAAAVTDELSRIQPVELIISEDQLSVFGGLKGAQALEAWPFLFDQALHHLLTHFKVHSLDGFGCAGMRAGIGAAGGVLHYLREVLRRSLDHVRRLQTRQDGTTVFIDSASRANLDLVSSRAGSEHTLLGAMDRTATPMGARRLRDWILQPLRDLEALRARQDLVEALMGAPFVLTKIRESLKGVRDIERTLARLGQASGNPRDLQSLASSLEEVPVVREHLESLHPLPALAGALGPRLRHFPELTALVRSALADEPPALLKEGGIFRDGYHPLLDELRSASTGGKQWIADLQTAEIERTGIKSLKVKFNAVFGYFIEITKSNLDSVPSDYQRRQTTVGGERFITPSLKAMEDKILGADERAKRLEHEEFLTLRSQVLQHMGDIQDTADALAVLDVLGSMAECARLHNYCRPVLNESRVLYVKDGRHPVLDGNLNGEKFVPNDVLLEPAENRLLILTGPNMAGKSTYIRQVALLTLMAQTGSFIPAAAAEIGLVDRIFTRVGASDDLSRGQSTFMVEMHETAAILNNATDRSLVILDEIGRGTATFDGLSIAWSVAEHLHDVLGCRTIFATHYHELTGLAARRAGVKNFSVAVREWNDRIIFLRKIIPGAADKSYGIQVARLAGLPKEILDRARAILATLEANAASPDTAAVNGAAAGGGGAGGVAAGTAKAPRGRRSAAAIEGPDAVQPQLVLFD
ncbi:MAG: DNA mismatch repair protein MutS [Verrucomicrobiaceae bacterium]|nr:MAG: DNA mismatch repair protein MutS [Verrucomicrobiaceae bacterium]